VHDYVPFESLLYVYDIQNDAKQQERCRVRPRDYKLNDQFSFTAGGRYTRVTEEFIGGQADLNCFPYGSALCNIVLGPQGYAAQLAAATSIATSGGRQQADLECLRSHAGGRSIIQPG